MLHIPSLSDGFSVYCSMLAQNIKFLRSQRKLSQQQLADTFQIPRTTLSGWERGSAEPSTAMLIMLAAFFQCTIDDLLTIPLEYESPYQGGSGKLRVLSLTVDATNKSWIELVNVKAEAGYVENFKEPTYIKELPKLKIPGLESGTYRGFEIHGDSMLPMQPGTVVICEFVEQLRQIKSGSTYVIVARPDGIVYKRVFNEPDHNRLRLVSDNPVYPEASILWQDVAEVWKYRCHISFDDPKQSFDQYHDHRIDEIQRKVETLYRKL